MGSRFTRRRFLTAAGAGAAYLALAGTVGSETPERSSKVRSSRTPRIKPLPGVPLAPEGVWAFRSRPDLNPPAVEVDTKARDGIATGYDGDHHEFLISPQDTALITIYNAVPRDLSSVGGSKDSVAIQGIVQELDIHTGEVLFEWRSIDHVALEETYVTPSEDHYPGIDYLHLNSIDIEPDNNLLISARETSAVYKIDRKTGEVMWRLGGKKSVFEIGTPKAVEESRAIVLKLDERKMKASLVREYTHPDKQYADAAGNMQVLPNGNVFVGWGRALAISEFSEDGELLFDFRVSPEHISYRAFRFPWSGNPSDQPAVAAERTSENELEVYASWNGATEIESWEVLAGPHPGRLESVGSVPRDGFETAMLVKTSEPYVAVQARHRSGRVLGECMPFLSK